MTRRLRLLCNPTAGGGRGVRTLEQVERALSGRGLELRVERTQSAAHAAQAARAAAEAGEEVVALGGDGMVRIAAHAVRGTGAVLGVLPGGRANDFACYLGLPRDPAAACAVLLDGVERTVDAGEVDGETFLGIASIGLESDVTRLANAAPRVGGRAVYAAATLVALSRWRPATFALELDGRRESFSGYLAAAANSGRFGGGMRLAPEASVEDGLLDLVMIEDGPRPTFLRRAPRVFAGTHVGDPRVRIERVREVRLAADRPFDVYADGEQVAASPATARVLPGALRVHAPDVRV